MGVIIILLVAGLFIAALFLTAFIWGAKNHQFDDNYAPPRRILFDEKPTATDNQNN